MKDRKTKEKESRLGISFTSNQKILPPSNFKSKGLPLRSDPKESRAPQSLKVAHTSEEMQWRLCYKTTLKKVLNSAETEKPTLLEQLHKIFISQRVENR